MTDNEPSAADPDLPQAADTDPAQLSSAAVARRAHRFLVPPEARRVERGIRSPRLVRPSLVGWRPGRFSLG
jgi:hypothetical protein